VKHGKTKTIEGHAARQRAAESGAQGSIEGASAEETACSQGAALNRCKFCYDEKVAENLNRTAASLDGVSQKTRICKIVASTR